MRAIFYSPSVRLSVTRVDKSKTVVVKITIVFAGKFHPEILTGSPQAGASNKGKVTHVSISKTVGDSPKLLSMTNRNSHMRFRFTPRSMTLT